MPYEPQHSLNGSAFLKRSFVGMVYPAYLGRTRALSGRKKAAEVFITICCNLSIQLAMLFTPEEYFGTSVKHSLNSPSSLL